MYCPPYRRILILCCLFVAVQSADAQDTIKWRTDYHAARKEADAKNLPILIDFVRPNCFPCEKMEQYTFKDPRILKSLTQQFIPLKINGLEDTQLAASLQVNLYPTLVLAGPDGKIAQTLIGFQEADALNDHLQRLLATLRPSDSMDKDFQNAKKWEADGDFVRAITTLKNILEDGKDRPIQKDARELMKKIEQRADKQLSLAKEQKDQGKFAESLETLTDLLRLYPGLAATSEASAMITQLAKSNSELRVAQRTKRVRELLTQAQDFYKSKDYIPCLDRCELIIANYGDLPEGQQAFSLAAEIKNNPEWLQAAADVMTDRLGGVYLALADAYLKRGEVSKAQHYLQRVVQAFPGSRLAESAQIRLSQMQGVPPDKNVARP